MRIDLFRNVFTRTDASTTFQEALSAALGQLKRAIGIGGDGIDLPLGSPPPGPDGVEPPAVWAPEADPAGGARDERVLAGARGLFAVPETRASFARAARYHSSNPEITGSYGGAPKCNLFVGDLLHGAGFAVPTYEVRGWDGFVGKHYKEAERWPKETAFFDKITDLGDLRPGDILVVDYLDRTGSGGGAHVEVITGVSTDERGVRRFTSMGARTRGLAEDEKHASKLASARRDGDRFFYDAPAKGRDADLFVLRPKQEAESGAGLRTVIRA